MIKSVQMSEDERYVHDNNLEEFLEPIEKQDYIAHEFTCPRGKEVYRTFGDAEKAIKQRGGRGKEKAAYKCNICGHFHITTKSNSSNLNKRFARKSKRTQNVEIKQWGSFTEEDVQKAKDNAKNKKERNSKGYTKKKPLTEKQIKEMEERISKYAMSSVIDEDTLSKLNTLINDTERTD